DEKRFLGEAIAAGKPVLGICLGAQLLADALGGKVFQNAEKEIGWWPVRVFDRRAPFAAFPETLTVMHWHGDTYTLPPGARGASGLAASFAASAALSTASFAASLVASTALAAAALSASAALSIAAAASGAFSFAVSLASSILVEALALASSALESTIALASST